MTALAENQEVAFRIPSNYYTHPMIAADIIYKNSFVGENIANGYARPLTAGDIFLGIARDKVDNSASGASNGDKSVECDTRDFEYTLTSVAYTDIGRPVYASDDNTLTYTGADNSLVGFVIARISSTKALIRQWSHMVDNIRQLIRVMDATGNQTLTADDVGCLIIVPNTAALELALPSATTVGDGAKFTFIKTTAAGGGTAVTLNPDGSETINGSATDANMDAQYDAMTITAYNGNWLKTNNSVA